MPRAVARFPRLAAMFLVCPRLPPRHGRKLRTTPGPHVRRPPVARTAPIGRTSRLGVAEPMSPSSRLLRPLSAHTSPHTLYAGKLTPATLGRRVSSIAVAHRLAGHQLDTRHPGVRDVLSGIRRTRGTAARRAAPATTDVIRRMAAACDLSTDIGLRDRALVLLGFAGAFRRSELVGIEVRHLAISEEGVRITLPRSKGDQDGQGEIVGVARICGSATCPVRALEAWLTAARIDDGPVFRSVDRHGRIAPAALHDRAVARIVQKLASAIGLDAEAYSGHSLRAGFATSAAMNGVEERRIARQTRHRSSVVRAYIRDGEVFIGNASREVGL